MSSLVVMSGKTIINICSIKFLFRQSTGNVENIRKFFNLSEGSKEMLTMASPGECIFSLNNSVTAMKFDIADYEKDFVLT